MEGIHRKKLEEVVALPENAILLDTVSELNSVNSPPVITMLP